MSTNNYIKHQGPRKNSKYHQGVVDSKKLTKYFDSCRNEPVIYRSGLEYQFIQFCENSPTVAKWASEVLKYLTIHILMVNNVIIILIM